MNNISSNDYLFSIVIATYNSEKTLPICLKSIEKQEFKNFELLILDGGSNDKTVEIIEENNKIVSYFCSEPDDGIYDAWNKSLSHIKGKWVLFLGSDDCFANDEVLAQLALHVQVIDPSTLFVFSEVQMVESINSMIKTEVIGNKKVSYYRKCFLNEMLFSHTGCLHRTDCFENFGEFDKNYKIGGDYDFILKCIQKDVTKIEKHESISIVMGQGGSSSSVYSRVLTYKEALKARKKQGIQHHSWILYYRLFVSYTAFYINKYLGNRALLTLSNIYRIILRKPTRTTYE